MTVGMFAISMLTEPGAERPSRLANVLLHFTLYTTSFFFLLGCLCG